MIDFSWRLNNRGMAELMNQLSGGLEEAGDRVLEEARARAPVGTRAPFGETRESLHVDKTHSHEWPRKAAVFVATANGYGFFVHEGTSDTPPHPFLSGALDSVRRDIPSIMRGESHSGFLGLF